MIIMVIIVMIIVIITATVIYLNVILCLCNAILPPACFWRWSRQKIAGPAASFALPPTVLQRTVSREKNLIF